MSAGCTEDQAILEGHRVEDHRVFLAEAEEVGYSGTGIQIGANDLYGCKLGTSHVDPDQRGTILAEYREFMRSPAQYRGRVKKPRTTGSRLVRLIASHPSGRLDPKYHIFKAQESRFVPPGWITQRIGDAMARRLERARPERTPNDRVVVLTISQTGELREREAGKGKSPPDWLGMYFEDSSSQWYVAHTGDVVFSSIDLWKGCIAVVPPSLDGALVTREFPIYRVTDDRLAPEFLSALLRSRHYQRAFRAITTGHSNRRRTQAEDFENLRISFPAKRAEQNRLIEAMKRARHAARRASRDLSTALTAFDREIEGS